MNEEQVQTFYRLLNEKNSWGKNEIRQLFLEVVAGIRK